MSPFLTFLNGQVINSISATIGNRTATYDWTSAAEQVLDVLRESAHEAETVYYLYVLDNESHLTGVLSLRDLVLAQPSTPISEIMETRVVTVDLLDSQEECAQLISKYNLLAVPVVDTERRLHGIVTADDALDKIIKTAWKKRLPRMYR